MGLLAVTEASGMVVVIVTLLGRWQGMEAMCGSAC